jgi:hypothetical protein
MVKKKQQSKRELTLHKLQALAESTTHAAEAEAARAKAEELKIHIEHVQTAPVNVGRDDPGTVVIGHWFREGDRVVICDDKGVPITHRAVQNYAKLLPDQNARQVARRLIKEMHGEDPGAGFYRRLDYTNANKGIV